MEKYIVKFEVSASTELSIIAESEEMAATAARDLIMQKKLSEIKEIKISEPKVVKKFDIVYSKKVSELSEDDKLYLLQIGHDAKEFAQIREAISKSKYELCDREGNTLQKLSASKAAELLGRQSFLSGIARSAFHWSAIQGIEGTDKNVFFDSSKLFRDA